MRPDLVLIGPALAALATLPSYESAVRVAEEETEERIDEGGEDRPMEWGIEETRTMQILAFVATAAFVGGILWVVFWPV